MADLSGLIERVEQATGADRDLNAAILEWLGWTREGSYAADPDGRVVCRVPDYTASVDAALALIARTLPGYSLSLVIDENGAKVSLGNGVKPAVRSACPTPPLALCLALLKAVQSKEGEGNV